MLYIIGLGLNEKGISLEGLEVIKKCEKIYLENYTVEFPYSVKELEKVIKKKVINANRELVEGNELVKETKRENIGLLVYGSPLTATTHISLIEEAKRQKIKYEIIYNASIFDAIAETGLQIYKFGKITSIPNFEAESFIDTIKENKKINAHSLILVDIGLKFSDAIKRLEKTADKIVVCSKLGTKDKKIFYGNLNDLRNKKIETPFCFIIPGKLHFIEEEVLKSWK
jgi:diphthine synthase